MLLSLSPKTPWTLVSTFSSIFSSGLKSRYMVWPIPITAATSPRRDCKRSLTEASRISWRVVIYKRQWRWEFLEIEMHKSWTDKIKTYLCTFQLKATLQLIQLFLLVTLGGYQVNDSGNLPVQKGLTYAIIFSALNINTTHKQKKKRKWP